MDIAPSYIDKMPAVILCFIWRNGVWGRHPEGRKMIWQGTVNEVHAFMLFV
jgi:hypothetical protein